MRKRLVVARDYGGGSGGREADVAVKGKRGILMVMQTVLSRLST